MTVAATGAELSDDELLDGFEGASLEPGTFHHEEHVRVAWLYCQRYEPAQAVERFVTCIRRLVTALGASDKYHETITWAYLLLIRERLEAGESWEEFAARSGDLLDPKGAVLRRYYSPGLLRSDRAKTRFVLPDRICEAEPAS